MKRNLPLFFAVASATALLFCGSAKLSAQDELPSPTIKYTSAPVTSAVEKVAYSTSISATITNNDELTFSAPILPSWLTLSTSGASSSHLITETIFKHAGGIAGDAQGNYYVMENGDYYYGESEQYDNSRIYKITPDGNVSLWTTINNQSNEYGYSWNYSLIIHDNHLYAAFLSGNRQGVMKFDMSQENPEGTMIYSGHGVLNITYRDGYIYTANYYENRVGRINLSDNSYSDYIPNVARPFGLGFTLEGDLLVASYGNYMSSSASVYKYSNEALNTVIAANSDEHMYFASDVKVDASGNVYVSYPGSYIRKYTPDFSSYTEIQGDIPYTYSMYLTPNGSLAFTDWQSGKAYALETGATLNGTPGHEHVGIHPVKIKVTNGDISKELEFTITVTDPNAPLAVKYLPENLSSEIAVDSTLHIEFNEKVKKGTGKIFIKNRFDNSVLKEFDVTSENISIIDSIVTIKLESKLPYLTKVYVAIEAGAIEDMSGNDFEGFSHEEFWAYTTDEIRQVPQSIEFAATRSVVYGAEGFNAGAVADSKLAVSYSSSDESIAAVIDGKIRVKKVGTVIITAKQEGSEAFFAAEPVEQQLVITPAPLVIKAENKFKEAGKQNPAFTFIYSGFVNGDNKADLASLPQASSIANEKSPIGYYDINVEGASSANYSITYEKGKLAVNPASDSKVKIWSSSPSELQVRIFAQVAQRSAIILYTDAGQPVVVQTKQLSAGVNSFAIPVSHLASSIYVFHVNAEKFQEAQRVNIK